MNAPARTRIVMAALVLLAPLVALPILASTGYTLVGWNNLGMHCMDSDYSLFSILPPYNTIHAQLIDPSGVRVRSAAGITITYEAVRDPLGSLNTTSIGKTNFWEHVLALFGASPAPDDGLAGSPMPGGANTPRPMSFDPVQGWWIAEGIPITPYDDARAKNPYPMMRLVARDSAGTVLATTDIVLPVSDEMDCTACHASDSAPAAMPRGGWIHDPEAQRDYRLNILLVHDDRQGGSASYQSALAALGFDPAGLYSTAVTDGRPILCARCHASAALSAPGIAGIPALTASMHRLHGTVVDPTNGLSLDSSDNRSACYRCHPGSTTRCLRGAMGSAVAADGTMRMQCQSCHGSMSLVGDPGRMGWLQEPLCQSCHTGNALTTDGRFRYDSAFVSPGIPRAAIDATFATTPDAPAPGLSLFRFSHGHGGLACEACHGSTHAELPSSHANDNVQSLEIQGHAGVLAECTACHGASPSTIDGGPHGMHPVGQAWISAHQSESGGIATGSCRACHGTDYRGTVLSRARGNRSLRAFGTKTFWKGFQIGCYTCHNGPGSDSASSNRPPVAQSASASAQPGQSVAIPLMATDPDHNALALRIVSQPAHGTAGLSGTAATYSPDPGFTGGDAFTFAAWDGSTDSNLATVSVSVGTVGCSLACDASAPSTWPELAAVPFAASAVASGCAGPVLFTWSFGDGAPSSSLQNPAHVYARAGSFDWTLTVSAGGQHCARSGSIAIDAVSPGVTDVRRLANPFRIRILGVNLHPTIQVTVAGVPWTNVLPKGGTKLILRGGAALKALFPANTFVPIALTNPEDGRSVTVLYNLTTNGWHVGP